MHSIRYHARSFGLIVLFASLSVAQTPAQPGSARTTLPPTIDLPRLVDLAAQRTGLTIDYDAKLAGSVTIRLNDEVSDSELWGLTNRLLAARGFTTVRTSRSGALSVVSLNSAAGLAEVEQIGNLAAAMDSLGDTQIFQPGFRALRVPLRQRAAHDVEAAIKPLLSSSGAIVTPLPELQSLLVADLTTRLPTVLAAIRELELGAASLEPVSVSTRFLGASELVSRARSLQASRAATGSAPMRGELVPDEDERSVYVIAPPDEVAGWRTILSRLDQPRPIETITYAASGVDAAQLAASIERTIVAESDVDQAPRVIADDLTGSVFVTGTAAQHDRIRELLGRLAEAPEPIRRPSRTIRLTNRDAAEVLAVLQSLIAAGMLDEPSSGAPAGGQSAAQRIGVDSLAAGAGSEYPDVETAQLNASSRSSLQLSADPATNTILAIGGPEELARLEGLIDDLDVRRPQVLLEVLIISLSESDSLDLGVEIEKLIDGPNDTIGKLASLFGLTSTGVGSAGIADRGAGFTGIVLNPGDFSVVVRAIKTLNQGRSLSMPKVLVASNEQASISSVLEQPYTTINASDTVATTAYGGSSPAGTEVSVRPQIAEGDHLRLEYSVSLSAFVGEAADASVPPPKQQNTIDSVATIPDGYTIAVGGIELETEGDAETGIPLLSDVPVLGEAFKNRSRSGSRSRFYVFIRPTILRDRDFEDLKYLSDLDVSGVGVGDGWPRVEPRLIR